MAVVQAEQPTPTADGAKAISLIGRWLRQALYALLAGAPVRPFSLTFESPELEARFRHEHFVGYLPVMRLALALGLLLYPSYAIIDLFVVPQAMDAALFIRFGLVGPMLLGTLAFSFHARFEAAHQILLVLIAGAAGLGICAMMALSPPPGSHVYYVGLIIVVIYSFHFMRLRFLYATALAWLFFAVYAAQATLLTPMHPAILIGSISLLATTNLIEMIAGYVQELSVRRDFLQRTRLAEGERRLQNIAANIPGSVFRCIRHADGSYSLRYMSEGLRHIFDRSPEALMANPEVWDQWIHPDDLDGWLAAFRQPLDDAESFHHEMRFIGDDGRIRWMRTTGRPHRRDNGDVVWDGINLDITDLRAREAELQQAQKMEAMGQLTGGVAHDFNNLLTVISGNLQLIAEDSAPDSEIAEMASDAQQAVDQGQALTRQLLAFARRQSLAPVATDLGPLIDDSIGLLRRTLGAQIELRASVTPALPPVLADAAHLQNAILNLALNASDAMLGSGVLVVQARTVELDRDYCRAHPDATPGEYVMLSVSDTGCGMTAETRDRAFEPFFTTKAGGGGSGLGLSMVYGYMRQTRGHVHIYSEPDKGTTVRLYLPVAAERPAPPPGGQEAVEQGNGELILLVEDNESVRRLARRMLGDLGYRVREACHGEDALARLDDSVDLLFTDMSMPGMNGAELASAARQRQPDLQVLFATGYAENSPIYEMFKECGALLLSKPYRKDSLARFIRQTLAQRDV